MNALTDLAHIQRAPIEGAINIPLELVKPSPTNPRRHFDAKKLDELADSIRKHTLMQPILVRPVDDARAGEPLYEIVAGERRWRASKLADTGTIMAISRPMSDFEVLELQLIENLQRDDLHPLEEAEGYQRLLRKPDGLQGYANAEELAARIGKSRSYVFQRLKLLDLCEIGRQAMAAGKLSFSVALLIARLPKPEQQEQATKAIVQGWGGEPFTFRVASDYIQRDFMLALDRATFRITDATLLPEAGSCRDCTKRTGANPDLFEDVQKDDTCTDAACYHAKEEAHRERLKVDAEQRGLEVISGKAAKQAMPESWSNRMKGYLALDEVHIALGTKPLRKLLGKDLPEVLLFENPHTKALVEVVREREALDRLKVAGKLREARMPSENAAERDRERKAKAEAAWREEVARQCVEAAAGDAGADATYRSALLTELALVIWEGLHSDTQRRAEKLLAWEHIGSEYASKGAGQRKEERIRALADGELCRYFTAVALAGQMYVSPNAASPKEKPQRLLDLAARLRVDADGIRARLRAERPTRVKAGQAKKAPMGAAKQPRGGADDGAGDTPETALAAALKKAKSAPAKVAVKYRDPATGSAWSGRGLQPAWLKAALASGRTLPEFLVKNAAIVAAQTASISAEAADPFRTH